MLFSIRRDVFKIHLLEISACKLENAVQVAFTRIDPSFPKSYSIPPLVFISDCLFSLLFIYAILSSFGGMTIVPMAGLPIKGLLIAPEGSHAYCIIKDVLSPDLIYKAIGTRNFSVCTRYLGPIPFLVIFDKDVPDNAITTLHDPDFGRSVIGNVLIFGKDDDGSFKSLSDFELTALRNNTAMLSKGKITYFGINNVTRSPGSLAAKLEDPVSLPPDQKEAISLMKDFKD